MNADVKARITERTRIANLHLREQGWLGRAANRTGLFIANGVDELTGWADNDRDVFMGSTAAGLTRGAAYGLLATIFAAALFPLGATAIPLLFTLMIVGAVSYGVYDGQKGLENHLNHKYPKVSDQIAEEFGTVPTSGHVMNLTQNPEETLRASGRDPELAKKVDAILKERAKATSFASREEARQSEVLPTQR